MINKKNNLTNRLLNNSLASVWGKFSTVIFRFIQLPILMHSLGLDDYGRWLVLYSFPSWLMLANFGFGSVASNEITMAVGKNDIFRARKIYNTANRMMQYILLTGTCLFCAIALLVPWENILKTDPARRHEIIGAVVFFAISTFLSFFSELYNARFKARQKSHLSTWFSSFRPWLELLLMSIVLQFSKRFDYLSLSILISTFIYIMTIKIYSFKITPLLFIEKTKFTSEDFKFLLKKGFAFQAFPLGNAMLYQGNLLVVQFVLGPASVAIFSTIRTLVRSINQMFELVNQMIWPEISYLFGEGQTQKIIRLHRFAVSLSLFLGIVSTSLLILVGRYVLTFWTGNTIALSPGLLFFFLIPIPFNALWFTSSVIHMASNQHEGLATRYLIAMSSAVVACYILTSIYGMYGAAVSTIISDIILIPYVFTKSLSILGDSWPLFISGIKEESLNVSKNFSALKAKIVKKPS